MMLWWHCRFTFHTTKNILTQATIMSSHVTVEKKTILFWRDKITLKCYIVKSVPFYSNITKTCILCLHEKFEILMYPNQDELLNKRSELVSKCRHINKYLLSNYKAND